MSDDPDIVTFLYARLPQVVRAGDREVLPPPAGLPLSRSVTTTMQTSHSIRRCWTSQMTCPAQNARSLIPAGVPTVQVTWGNDVLHTMTVLKQCGFIEACTDGASCHQVTALDLHDRLIGSFFNLVVAAIALWNTVYLERAADALARSRAVDFALFQHVSPLGWEHINLTGDYTWHTNKRVAKGGFRPLRTAKKIFSAP